MNTFQDYKAWKTEAINNAIKNQKNLEEINVHIVVSNDDNKLFTAHALEFDIVAEGKSKDKALKELLEAIISHISFCMAYGNMDKIVFPAPDEFWEDFFEKMKAGRIDKPKIPRLSKDTQLPFRPSRIGKMQVAVC